MATTHKVERIVYTGAKYRRITVVVYRICIIFFPLLLLDSDFYMEFCLQKARALVRHLPLEVFIAAISLPELASTGSYRT